MRSLIIGLAICALLLAPTASFAAGRCGHGKSSDSAMWYSILHPGLGEWYLKDWGSFDNAPQKKFWLGFIPFYGWPGYLQVKSARDAKRCNWNDNV
jgi:hypothetical protein